MGSLRNPRGGPGTHVTILASDACLGYQVRVLGIATFKNSDLITSQWTRPASEDEMFKILVS